ncbi:DEAD/DEAH box helicase [Rhodococcus hoagii]|uniref:DEAD/DEAH box helicase n=1 Tax=Rhodococcus hoagii TaxID=43767 RepID=UPI0009BCC47E|nr:DEAD/DEAH box helicase [Prescottella equi]MBM4471363.1 DEAD/DEAH box helicase [Prescottella equi]NKR39544.1 DEAD/DEAH box helicase [Prescottella equi]NKR49563.1 DEAD/DEAH box helicase [Prescottella equi]NKR72353.1 DEAD/DEAH box helicase [Prescottella equi]NKS16156.1 DEAD/DEAH box helicase [Prescottella equi]
MSDRPLPTFAQLGLPPILVHALGRAGVSAPFPIQAATIPDILAGRDVLGRGPTGSGKTLAFGLPLLVRLKGGASRPSRPRAVVLAPTRELAAQIEKALDEPALALGLRTATIVGGVPFKAQAVKLSRTVDVVIATPGRLADHVSQGTITLDDVRITTVDEADHMAELGFLPQVTEILDRTPETAQRLLFSATLDGEVDTLVARYLHDPVTHATAEAVAAVDSMEHHVLHVPREIKYPTVARIAARKGRTLLFVRTKAGVDRLTDELRAVGIAAGGLHGDKPQGHRTRVLAEFAGGTLPVLVATDVAARGIHVDDVSLVVHVDPPTEPKAYLHRAGRTARAGESGVVVTVVTEEERGPAAKVMRAAGVDVDPLTVGGRDRRWEAVTGAREPSGTPVPEPETASAPPKKEAPADRRGPGPQRGFRGRGGPRRDGTGRPESGQSRRRRGGS